MGSVSGNISFVESGLIKGFVVDLDGTQCQSISIADGGLVESPGASTTFVQGIKNSGEVVGSYDYGDGTGSRGFIATPK